MRAIGSLVAGFGRCVGRDEVALTGGDGEGVGWGVEFGWEGRVFFCPGHVRGMRLFSLDCGHGIVCGRQLPYYPGNKKD